MEVKLDSNTVTVVDKIYFNHMYALNLFRYCQWCGLLPPALLGAVLSEVAHSAAAGAVAEVSVSRT